MLTQGIVDAEEVRRILDDLLVQQTAVATLLEATADEVRSGMLPDRRALEVTARFAGEFERVLVWLEARSARPPEATLETAVEAVDRLLLDDRRRTSRALDRRVLARLERAEVPTRFDADRTALARLARELAADANWTPEQESLVGALGGLARICDLAVAGDTENQIPDIDVSIRPRLPADLQRILSAAIASSVTLPPLEEPPAARAAGAAGPEATDPIRADEPAAAFDGRGEPNDVRPFEAATPAVEEPAPPQDAPAPASGPLGPSADADAAAARLMRERRHGLASWLLSAMGEPGIDVRLLQAAALGEGMRTSAGIVTPAFRDIVGELGDTARDASEPVKLLAFAAAVRAALVSPASGGADLVQVLRYAVRSSPAAEAIASAIYDASSRGVAYAGAAVARVRDVVELQTEVETLAAYAAEVLGQGRSRTVKYAPATDVWKAWIDGPGVLAGVMRPAAENRTAESVAVVEQVIRLRAKGALDRLIDETYARVHPGRRVRLIAGARATLLEWANDLLDIAMRWTQAVDALEAARAAQGHGRWRQSAEEALRREVSGRATELFEALDAVDGTEDARLRASAAAARTSLHQSFGLLRGEALSGDELPPAELLNGELLKVQGLEVGRDLEPTRHPTVAELLTAATCDDWQVVFRRRVDDMDHEATRAVIDIVRRTDPDLAARLEAQRDAARRGADRRLRGQLAHVAADVERARRLGHVVDTDGDDLGTQVEELRRRLERDEFGSVNRDLAALGHRLETARVTAQEQARRRLADAITRSGEKVAAHELRIRQRIDDGDIVTADEFVAQAEATGELIEPEPDPDGLAPWYPVFSERLRSSPLHRAMARAVGDGERSGNFDFGAVPANRRELAQRALEGWLRLRDDRGIRQDVRLGLQDLLRLLGMRAESAKLGQRAKDHQWLDLRRVTRTGRPLVPQFGSASAETDGSSVKLLVCWTAPAPETVAQWCDSEGGARHVLVLYPELFSAEARRALTAILRRQHSRQAVAVVDDAVVLWLCLAPEPPFESLMRAVLPFTAINPYNPWSTGNVPPEMFYGRRRELEEVKALDGTSFIFGGRQFGKSALLRRVERDLDGAADRVAVYIDVDAEEVGSRKPTEAIWEVLWRQLGQRGLWPAHEMGRTGAEQFADAVRGWLGRHPSGRLLLLLDECDRFLDADARQVPPFATVARLKSLREETKGRFKPVFAGLHLVQRYQDIPNQPLAHLGRPISIGTLHPRDAFELISRPMNALGYRFASDDLVYRITAFCGNHPSLLQFFGGALVRHMQAQPLHDDRPPQRIVERDVEAVIADRELLSHFRDRFRLTLELDPRYKVVADVIALEAVERGSAVTMRADEIRQLAMLWWPAGFQAMQSEDAFRSVLDEMVGLGVLVLTANGYRMRTPNVLRLLGDKDEIETRLLGADAYRLPEPFEADAHRRVLPGGLSPLTERQLGDLLKPRSRSVVVVGSEATAIERVTEAVRQGAIEARLAVHLTRLRPGRSAREPEPTGMHTIWVIDALGAGADDIRRAADAASIAAGRRAVTAVLLAGTVHADWLARFVLDSRSGLDLMELRRLDEAGLRWMESMAAYGTPAASETVLRSTGGWPILVERFRKHALEGGRSFDAIVHEIEAEIGDGGLLVDAVGLRRSSPLERVWAELVELDEPGTMDQLAGVLHLGPAETPALELLRMFGALVVLPNEMLACEETLKRAWRRLATS